MPVWTDPYGQRVAPPPDLQLGLREAAASAAEPAASVALALSRCDLAKFPWKEPKGLSPSYAACLGPGKMRSAMLVGDLRHGAVVESRECFAGLMWMEKGSSYPAHCHDANEMFQIVLGATSTWSRRADLSEPGAFAIPSCPYLHHGPRQPHAVRTAGDEDMLCVYFWSGDLYGRYWFCADGEPEVAQTGFDAPADGETQIE